MIGFIVEAANEPGQLARVTEALSERGINLTSAACIGYGDRGAFAFLSNDESGTRSALEAAGIAAREVEMQAVTLTDRPGALAEAARRLGDAGVNVELVLVTGASGRDMRVAIGTSDAAAARQALGDLVAAAV